jgi:CO/xanthine dehydrogenase FAD-binding subunit
MSATPSAEIPLIVCTLDAIMIARNTGGERRIAANEFFDFAMTTALEPDECLTEIRFPFWREANTGHGFHEVSIRDSDFALAAAASQATLDGSGHCTRLHIAIGGASPTPMRLTPVEQALMGTGLSDTEISDACAAILGLVEPQSDVHADAEYRRRVARVMAERAIASARDAAGANR